MRHDVESKIQRAAPDVFDAGVGQLRININHSATQDLSAAPDGLFALRKKRRAAAEQHAAVGGEPVVMKKVFGIEDHAMTRAQFRGERWRQDFGGNDERTDRDQLLLQGRSGRTGVSAGSDEYSMRPDRAAGGG